MAGNNVKSLFRSGKLKKLTERTITDPEVLNKVFEKIRRQGYAISRGEAIPGACGIAAPVFGEDGRIRAALSFTYPESLSPKNGIDDYVRRLKRQAEKLSADLGFIPRKLVKTG